MKIKRFIIIFISLFTIYLIFGLKDKDNNDNLLVVDAKKLDANTISTWFRNNGSFNKDPLTGNAGFEWPKNSNKNARFYSGLCLGAIVNNDTLTSAAIFDEDYVNGYTDSFGNPQGRNDTNYRIYKLDYGINNIDRQRWPNNLLGNSNQGAPVYFDTLTNSWKPTDFGTQTMYMLYTDSDTSARQSNCGSILPLKADIKMLNFVNGGNSGPLAHTVFTEFKVINRSNKIWNNFYVSIYTDDDIGDALDDKYGCDSVLSLGYMYNGDDSDYVYGKAPPAVSFIMLKGMTVYTGNQFDTLKYCVNKSTVKKIGYKNIGLSVCRWIRKSGLSGWTEPINYRQTYNTLTGKLNTGETIFHPNGYPTTFSHTGDPVTNAGWLLDFNGDARFMISSGPVTMNPNDTQSIVIAQVIARGSSNLNSITVLRQYTQEVWNYYRSCYSSVQIGIEVNPQVINSFHLYQNYPNPFNPTTKIKFNIPPSLLREGQGLSLIIYDLLGREIATLVNEQQKPGTYEIEWDGSKFASGVYYYKLIVRQAGSSTGEYNETRKMVLLK